MLEPVLVGNSEFLASVTATGRKHAATVGSAHALAEAMLVDTFVNVGLECPFHCMLFYILFWIYPCILVQGTAKVVILSLNAKLFSGFLLRIFP